MQIHVTEKSKSLTSRTDDLLSEAFAFFKNRKKKIKEIKEKSKDVEKTIEEGQNEQVVARDMVAEALVDLHKLFEVK